MRLSQLGLRSFGHFRTQDFVFDPPNTKQDEGGFYLIYGPNEAGKSTSLRAVRALLYGVPQQSADAFLGGSKELRLIGTVTDGHRTLSFQRRKGRKNTLLDPAGEPLELSKLTTFLGGVDEGMFTSVFGLNHEGLRLGAEQLLLGRGKLAEGLFGVGLGAGSVRGVLTELQAEADALYTPRGRTRKRINLLNSEVRDAERQVSDLLLVPAEYIAQQERLRAVEAQLADLQQQRSALIVEREAIALELRLLPKFLRRVALLEELSSLGQVVQLPAEFGALRRSTEQREQAASDRAAYAKAEVDRARVALEALAVPELLAALDPEMVERLQGRMGAQRKAADDLPKRRAELRQAMKASDELISLYGHGVGRDGVHSLRLDRAQEKLLERLSREKTRFDAQLSERAQKLRLAEQEYARRKKETAALPAAVSIGALRREIGQVKMHLRDESRLAQRRRDLQRLERRIQDGLEQLGPFFCGGIDELLALAVPSDETLQGFAQRFLDLEQEVRETARASDALRLEIVKANEERSHLLSEGELPRLDQLKAIRRSRDKTLDQAVGVVESSPHETVALLSRARSQTREADDYADRLRAESRRSTQLEAAVAKVAACERALGVHAERATNQDARRLVLANEWHQAWPGLSAAPGGGGQMKDWVRRRRGLVELAEQRQSALIETREIEANLSQVSETLGRVLEELGEPRRQLWEGPTQMVERAEQLQETLTQQNELRRSNEQRGALAAQALQDANRQYEECKEAHRKWKPDWSRNLKMLHLDKGAGAEEVTAKVEGLSSLFAALRREDELGSRIASIESDAKKFALEVQSICQEAAPELRGLDSLAACARLLSAYRRARSDLDLRERLGKQLERHEAELRRANSERSSAQKHLSALVREAGVGDRTQLSEAERRSESSRVLQDQLRALEFEMLELGGGLSLQELVKTLRPLCVDETRRRGAELPALIETIEAQLLTTSAEQGELAARLQERQSGAMAAAELAAQRKTELKAAVERYAAVRLAMRVLQSEVDRYREQHQGPILRQGSKWFSALTLNRYSGLSIGYDQSDNQLLQCVIADGREVEIGVLSEGTRDQLYLALRLATWEHYFSREPSVPIVLDDVLVHFDDERAAAALAALGELSSTTQILFFTHHARLRDLAVRWVPEQRLRVHELGGAVSA